MSRPMTTCLEKGCLIQTESVTGYCNQHRYTCKNCGKRKRSSTPHCQKCSPKLPTIKSKPTRRDPNKVMGFGVRGIEAELEEMITCFEGKLSATGESKQYAERRLIDLRRQLKELK